MFGEKIGESSTTTGTGTIDMGGAYGVFRTWRTWFANNDTAFYLMTLDDGSIWEIGYGTFTVGSPDRLTRTLIASSTGSLINWSTTFRVYSIPTATALKHMLSPLAAAKPAWLPLGALWLDYALGYTSGSPSTATAWINKLWNGTTDIEMGRAYMSQGIYVSNPRNLWVDKGANAYTVTTADPGKVFAFDVTAANRAVTFPDGATAGHGFSFAVYGYGGSYNVVLTPAGTNAIDAGANSATLSVPPNTLVRISWDGARSKWITDTKPAAVIPRGHLAGMGLTRTSTTVVTCGAGMCTDSTGAAIISVPSSLAKSTAGAWAAGNSQNGMGNGLTIANNTWYHVYAMVPSGTAMVNGVYAGDFYFDTSASGANKPTGTLFFRRIGSFKTNGSAQIIDFLQIDDWFIWVTPPLDINTTNPGTSMVTATMSGVPTGFKFQAKFMVHNNFASNSAYFYFHSLDQSDEAAVISTSFGGGTSAAGGQTAGWQGDVWTNTSAQIGYRLSASGGGDTVYVKTLGWRDPRGRDLV